MARKAQTGRGRIETSDEEMQRKGGKELAALAGGRASKQATRAQAEVARRKHNKLVKRGAAA